jgi:hypothetical protein
VTKSFEDFLSANLLFCSALCFVLVLVSHVLSFCSVFSSSLLLLDFW